jgi:GDP-L-fucose synthase
MSPSQRVFVAGHRGMVGSAIVRRLERRGYGEILTQTRAELDLTRQADVERYMEATRPDVVVVAAAKVGGIVANNTFRGDFIRENLAIELNLIEAARRSGVQRLLFLGSSCVYPRDCPQPIREEYLLTGPLEATNQPYAIAKIAGIEMCRAYNAQYGTRYLPVMPTNLYGPGDNYHPTNSHVIPGLIRRFHEARLAGAKSVTLWGTGTPRREFLHVDDLAEACVFLLENTDETELTNIGTGEDVTIRELAELVARTVGFAGRLEHDLSKPDGTPRKQLDVSRLAGLGWKARIGLEEGLRGVFAEYERSVGAVSADG